MHSSKPMTPIHQLTFTPPDVSLMSLRRRFLSLVGRFVLFMTGWKLKGHVPEAKKFVIVCAPHTSNWDFIIMLFVSWAFGLRIKWLGKNTIFKPPWGPMMRKLGGIAVDRRQKNNLVQQVIDYLGTIEEAAVAVPAEGTRRKTEGWKSGFYHIASGANIPIVFGFIDYEKKITGAGPNIMPTGDMEADMAHIRNFFDPIVPKHPENKSTIQFLSKKK